jgi:SAM-dependent methyltransferase
MILLTQARMPALWNLFQWTIGGTVDKRKLCAKYYSAQKRVLEVGCSVGNIAVAFRKYPDIQYVGIDVDQAAIEMARKRFIRFTNFSFHCQDLSKRGKIDGRFGYILLAGILHHLADDESRSLLHTAAELLDEDGLLVVVDPVLPESGDNPFLQFYLKTLEQGRYVRDGAALDKLLHSEPGLLCCDKETCLVAATPIGWPKCARFGIWQFRRCVKTMITGHAGYCES